MSKFVIFNHKNFLLNRELKSEIGELRRSYSPFPRSSNSNSNTSIYTPQRYSQNLFQGKMVSSGDLGRFTNENNSTPKLANSTESTSTLSTYSRSNRRKIKTVSPMEKKVRFSENCMTEKMKHELEYQDDTIFQSLSIFKDLDFPKSQQITPAQKSPRFEKRFNEFFHDFNPQMIEKINFGKQLKMMKRM